MMEQTKRRVHVYGIAAVVAVTMLLGGILVSSCSRTSAPTQPTNVNEVTNAVTSATNITGTWNVTEKYSAWNSTMLYKFTGTATTGKWTRAYCSGCDDANDGKGTYRVAGKKVTLKAKYSYVTGGTTVTETVNCQGTIKTSTSMTGKCNRQGKSKWKSSWTWTATKQ